MLEAGNKNTMDASAQKINPKKIKILIWRNCWQNFQIIKIGC